MLTPEDITNCFLRIQAFHKSFRYNNLTVAGWGKVLNGIRATQDEVVQAICDHAASEVGVYEPKVANIVGHIRTARGIEP